MTAPASDLQGRLERHQIAIYFGFVGLALIAAFALPSPSTLRLESAINPALAAMLFVTFLQVPLHELAHAFRQPRFLGALTFGNFIAVPLLVAALLPLMPGDPVVRLGILIVLLTPCVDYVVTFAHLGRADARAVLAATPLLLLAQMALLPLYLSLFLGADADGLIAPGPFIHAFLWLIAGPLALAAFCQAAARRSAAVHHSIAASGALTVPATALVLFIVVAAAIPQLGGAWPAVLSAVPAYLLYAALAPFVGLALGRMFELGPEAVRAVAFSTATRNSLVVLPFALAAAESSSLLAAVIVSQTLVELVAQLIYIRALQKLVPNRNIDPHWKLKP